LETDFIAPVPVGSTLFIKARITGQSNRKVYSSAEGYLNGPDGILAMKASSLFVIVPMQHFLDNAPKAYLDHVRKHPELLAFVDPDFEINP
jgi:predicted thioesterase